MSPSPPARARPSKASTCSTSRPSDMERIPLGLLEAYREYIPLLQKPAPGSNKPDLMFMHPDDAYNVNVHPGVLHNVGYPACDFEAQHGLTGISRTYQLPNIHWDNSTQYTQADCAYYIEKRLLY